MERMRASSDAAARGAPFGAVAGVPEGEVDGEVVDGVVAGTEAAGRSGAGAGAGARELSVFEVPDIPLDEWLPLVLPDVPDILEEDVPFPVVPVPLVPVPLPVRLVPVPVAELFSRFSQAPRSGRTASNERHNARFMCGLLGVVDVKDLVATAMCE
jgi:hypothetical protein